MSLLENQVGGEKRLAGIPILGNPSLATPNLQFDSINNRFIWVAIVPASLSEIEFIRDQIKLGNWLEANGSINTLGNTVFLIPAAGKTIFLYEAKIVMSTNPVPSKSINVLVEDQVVADLTVDGVVKDKATVGVVSQSGQFIDYGASDFGGKGDGRFNVKGLSLIGDGVKQIRIVNVLDDGNAFATMSGFIEDT